VLAKRQAALRRAEQHVALTQWRYHQALRLCLELGLGPDVDLAPYLAEREQGAHIELPVFAVVRGAGAAAS
jgi:hypothetical protein